MEAIQQITAVAGVLALLLATLWWLRRRGLVQTGFVQAGLGRKPGRRRLEAMERLPLGPQHTLHLVRLGDTMLLLASSPAGCSLVTSAAYREIAGTAGAAQ